jgi:hypothetical protein
VVFAIVLLSNFGRKISITILSGKFNLYDFEQVVGKFQSLLQLKITVPFTFGV